MSLSYSALLSSFLSPHATVFSPAPTVRPTLCKIHARTHTPLLLSGRPTPRSYCPADPLLCLPGLLLLFIILRRESCCCFLSLCRCLLQEQQGYQSRPLPQRPLLCPCCRRCSVCDSLCVVTLIIMDSARVFRLSAGSWSTRTTLSSTCTQTCAGMRTHTHWWCAWLHTCTGAHMAAHAHKRNTHCAEV